MIDTTLRSFGLPFELHRTEIPQRGVPPPGIVEALDVIEHVGFCLVSCVIQRTRGPLGLQRGEEAFHRRVVPAVAGATHATSQALVRQEPLERLAGVLAASIRVMRHRFGLASPPDGHDQRIGNQLSRHRHLYRPPDDPSGEEINNCSDVEPPFGRPDIREVGHPFAIGGWGIKLAIEHIRRHCARRLRASIGRHPPPSGPCPQGLLPHQSLDLMQATHFTLGQEVVPHASRTVGPVTLQETRPDLGAQHLVATSALAAWPREPRIEPTPRDTERLA